ncbi:MAG: hypothetical protein H7A49_07005 [Akkermansiaceae bacterium]|nr:hypothetical protein [Akkermansiaceae bacterium]
MKPVLLFLCGSCLFAAGWLAGSWREGSKIPPPVTQTGPSRTTAHTRSTPYAADSRNTRLRALAEDPIRLETEIENLSTADIPALVEILAARGGINGLGWKERSKLEQMVRRYYDESPEDTLAWILATRHEGNRNFYIEVVLEGISSEDPARAMELADRYHQETGAAAPLTTECFAHMAKQGADAMLRALELTTTDKEDGGVSANSIEFPKDFDFAAMAAGLSALRSRMGEGEHLTFMPNNFIRDWVRRDPQAAYEWSLSVDDGSFRETIPFINGLSGFFEAYAEVAEPAEYGRFAAEATMGGEITENSWRNAFRALSDSLDSVAIESFFAEAPSHVTEEEVLKKLLDISNYYGGGQYDQLRSRLFERMTEEQRTRYLPDAPAGVRRKLGVE